MNYSARTREGSGERSRPRVGVLILLAIVAIAGAAGAVVLKLNSEQAGPEPGLQIALLDWIVLANVLSGLVAWWRRPESRFGPLMVAGGYLVLVGSLSSANSDPWVTIGQLFDLLAFAVFLHVYLAFPSGRLTRRMEVGLVACAYAVAIGVQLFVLMIGGFNPDNFLAVASHPVLAVDVFELQLTALAAIMLGGIVVLVSRRRTEGRPLRRATTVLVNSFAIALLGSAALLMLGAWGNTLEPFLTIQRITFFTIGLAPIAFLYAILDARLARASVGDLIVELRTDPAPGELKAPLSRALNDPSLTLAYWLPQYGVWADEDGRPVELPAEDGSRAVTTVDRDGQRFAALIHDPSLKDEPELLNAVGAAAGIALENGQLQAELKARLEELKESRGRVITAEQEERKRLERNLHDGAQQRLIALSLELSRLGQRLDGDPHAQQEIDAARAEIAVSLDELRDVARGLHPAVLSGHGLDVALQSLAATSPVAVALSVDVTERLSEPIEVAAYYVVSESLANIAKHAQAESATVDVARGNGMLVVEVTDDGIGGADSERGSGLRGLADRVEALGGRLRVWTPAGEGTRVRAELPCE